VRGIGYRELTLTERLTSGISGGVVLCHVGIVSCSNKSKQNYIFPKGRERERT
jgi:hypothetical protein